MALRFCTTCVVIFLSCFLENGQSTLQHTVYEAYENHPCRRPCVTGQSMVCEYDFYLEYFITMGKNCGNCPTNMTDCYNRGCVTADGNQRYIMTVNQMLPGPGIHVCEDDVILVRVHNWLTGREGTAIHWHGVLLKHQQHMDGTPMVTQCHIPFATSFEYRFKADTPGTHYWHALSGSQRAEGVFGALIIRQPVDIDPHGASYQRDLPEHTMIVMDWFEIFMTEMFTLAEHGTQFIPEKSILMNGKSLERDFFTMPDNRTRNFVPVATFNVQQGQTYRFRVISNGIGVCPIQVSVDNHMITAIATDGMSFEKVEVESFYITSGERYDFILDANQPIGRYWIRLQGTEYGCGPIKVFTGAILEYAGATEGYPEQEFTSYEQAAREGKSLNKWGAQPSEDNIQLTDLVGLKQEPAALKAIPDKKLFLRINITSKETYNRGASWVIQINDISIIDPPSPPLTQYKELDESIFCNEDTVNVNCSEVYCECVYRIKIALNDVVEMVVINEGEFGIVHPMHLHGHKYYIVGTGKLGETTGVKELKNDDEAGKLSRNLDNPVAKDTVAPDSRGYVILRWHATNPGFWLFHCDMQYHQLQGQGLIFQVGESHEMPYVPHYFPRCGDWRRTDVDNEVKCTNGQRKQTVQVGILFSLVLLLKLILFQM